MNIRIILTLIGLATGWFLFEETIIGAVVFEILGVVLWFGHKRKQNRIRKKSKLKNSGK